MQNKRHGKGPGVERKQTLELLPEQSCTGAVCGVPSTGAGSRAGNFSADPLGRPSTVDHTKLWEMLVQ